MKPRPPRCSRELSQGRGSFHVAPRTRQVFRKLRPMLLEWLAQAADPDATLTQFVRFVEAYGMRSLLFELLVANPRLLELLVKTFDASRHAGDLLIRRPQLLEDSHALRAFSTAACHGGASISNALAATGAAAGPTRSGPSLSAGAVAPHYSARCSRPCGPVEALAGANTPRSRKPAWFMCTGFVAGETDLTIIALGKFGGAEMSYGADLDVVFVGENTRAAAGVNRRDGQSDGRRKHLPARRAAAARWRKRVRSPVRWTATSATTGTRAQFWEIQALTRARPDLRAAQTAEFLELAQQRLARAPASARICFAPDRRDARANPA